MKAGGIVCAVLALWAIAAAARAEDRFGLGLILGEPTGISAKKWLDDRNAIDAAAAWSLSDNTRFQFHADYLFHNYDLLKADPKDGRLSLYCGLGGRVLLSNNDNPRGTHHQDDLFGLRVPLGISFMFTKVPLDLFGEVVPILDLVPVTDFDLNLAVGARFYF